jgi:hypothetical protein
MMLGAGICQLDKITMPAPQRPTRITPTIANRFIFTPFARQAAFHHRAMPDFATALQCTAQTDCIVKERLF